MEKLTNKEEEIMRIIWKLEKAFVKEIIPHIKEKTALQHRFYHRSEPRGKRVCFAYRLWENPSILPFSH